jgi:hypothetical protein
MVIDVQGKVLAVVAKQVRVAKGEIAVTLGEGTIQVAREGALVTTPVTNTLLTGAEADVCADPRVGLPPGGLTKVASGR